MLSIPAPARPAAAAVQVIGAALLDAFVVSVRPLVDRLATRARHVVVVDRSGIVLHAFKNGRIRPPMPLGTDPQAAQAIRSGDIEVRLPPDLFLTRTLRLPDAGRGYLGPIIAHRLERLTPWRADKVLYGYSVVEGVSEDGTIGVDLLATSVDLAAPFLSRVQDLGLVATAVGSAAEPLDAPLRFDLYKGRVAAADGRLRTRIGHILVIGFAVLVLGFLATALMASYADADAQESVQRLAALRTKLGSRGGPGTSRERLLIQAKRPDTAMVVIIDKLSRALPDDTVLRELDITPTRVRLVGRSNDASALIARIENGLGLSNPRFAAPVIRDAEKRDAFDLVANRGDAPEVVR